MPQVVEAICGLCNNPLKILEVQLEVALAQPKLRELNAHDVKVGLLEINVSHLSTLRPVSVLGHPSSINSFLALKLDLSWKFMKVPPFLAQ